MTVSAPLDRHDAPTANAPKPKRAAHLVLWTVVVALLVTNATTLLIDRAHDVAYGVVESMAERLLAHGIAETLLSSSPTRAKTSAVKIATRQLEAERSTLHAKNDALIVENESIKASKAALAKDHDALRAVALKRAAAVRAVATRTSTVLTTRSAEAVSTLPARAAPYLGIAALVGFTTLELKADCEVARSLADLNAEHGNAPIDVGQVCKAVDGVPSPHEVWNTVKTQASSAIGTTYDALESAATRLGLPSSLPPRK